MIENQVHPQSASFQLLFPKPDADITDTCLFSQQFKGLWEDCFKESALSFIGLTAKSPDYDHRQAELSGNDYDCTLHAHFKKQGQDATELKISLGRLPYPDQNGEFVLRGNRYYLPMILCTEKKINDFRNFLQTGEYVKPNDTPDATPDSKKANDRDTDSLNVLLIDELLAPNLRRRLHRFVKILESRSWDGDITQLRTISRSLLKSGNLTVLHKYIYRFGKLVDRENPLSRVSQQKEMSFYYPGLVHSENTREFILRDVDDKDLYRICPVQTPQGHKVGLITHMARRASVDLATRKLIPPKDPSAGDSLSDGASLIPFIEHDDVSRALMGTNMMKQALPLKKPDMPLIQTGGESLLGQREKVSESFKKDGILALGRNLLSAYMPWGLDTFEDGIVISESAAEALTSSQEKTIWFNQPESIWWNGSKRTVRISADSPRIPDHEKKVLDDNGIVKPGTVVKPGDLLVCAYSTAHNNINKTKMIDVFAAEDSIDKILGKEPDECRDLSLRMPHNFKGEVTRIIDSNDTAEMKPPSDIVRRIGIVIRRLETAKVGDKITSRHGAKGVIVRILPDRDMPYQKTSVPYCTDVSCPVAEPHRHIQVILNPIGVLGRLNLGQLYETALAKVSKNINESINVKPFENPWGHPQIKEALVSNGFSEDGKEQLYIFANNTETKLRYKSLAGPQYFIRLNHLPEDKIQGRAAGRPYDYTLRDDQPRQGKRIRDGQLIGSGQRFGEMETWALAGNAAWNILDDLLTVKSDDGKFRRKRIEDLKVFGTYRRPQSLVNLILVFRSLGLDLRLLDKNGNDVTQKFLKNSIGEHFSEVALSFASPEQIKEWLLGGQVTSLNLYNSQKKNGDVDALLPDPAGLLSREIFDPQKPWQMGVIKLACPIDHPLMKKEYLGPKGNPEDYMLDSIAVLPVRFRQERLGIARDFQNDLNILYRNVLQINSQLETVLDDENSNDELQDFLKKRLFNAVKKLFSVDRKYRNRRRGIIDILKGKEALVRGHMLGKRVDYSGRAVIIGDSSLPLDEASIPDELWDKILPDVPRDEKPLVLLNRQPSLHRYSIQAFRVSTHRRGNVICINPFVCKPFNADFDGDTIAIHVPRTDPAKTEAEKLLPSRNLLSNANGKMVLGFDKDFALAAAYITFNKDSVSDHDEVPFTSECDVPLEGKDYWEEVTVQGIKTNAGRLRLKRLFGDIPILNRCMDKRDWFQNLERLTQKASKENPEILIRFAHDISILFQEALKRSGLSLSFSDFSDETSNECAPSLLWFLRKSGKYSEDVEKQIVLKRGRMRRPGRDDEFTEPIESCLLNGHSKSEYLCSAHGARAGLVDKGLITSYSGYFLRDLIYKLQHLYIIEEDCRASNGLIADNIDHDQILGNRFVVDDSLANEITKETPFRSPLTCTGKDSLNHAGICQKCYGLDPATGKLPEIGLPVGILAAQAIGERVSQETLKSFHTGGKVETENKGLALVRYLREAFSEASKNASVQKLIEIYNQFPESNRPHLVHFEIVLAGYMSSKNGDNFLSKLAHSQAPRWFFKTAVKGARDDLNDVISKIVSGRIISPGMRGNLDA